MNCLNSIQTNITKSQRKIPPRITSVGESTSTMYNGYSILVFTDTTTTKTVIPIEDVTIGYCVIGGGGAGGGNHVYLFGGSGGGVNISSINNSTTTLKANVTYTITVGVGLKQTGNVNQITQGGNSSITGSGNINILGRAGLSNSAVNNSMTIVNPRLPVSITTTVNGTPTTTVSGVGGNGEGADQGGRNKSGSSGVILSNYTTEIELYGTVAGGGGGSNNGTKASGSSAGGAGGGGGGTGWATTNAGGACSVKYGGSSGTYLFGYNGSNGISGRLTNYGQTGDGGTGVVVIWY